MHQGKHTHGYGLQEFKPQQKVAYPQGNGNIHHGMLPSPDQDMSGAAQGLMAMQTYTPAVAATGPSHHAMVPTTINTYVAGELTIKQQGEAIKLSEEQMRVQRLQAEQEIELENKKAEAARQRKLKDAETEIEIQRMKRAAELELRTKHKADLEAVRNSQVTEAMAAAAAAGGAKEDPKPVQAAADGTKGKVASKAAAVATAGGTNKGDKKQEVDPKPAAGGAKGSDKQDNQEEDEDEDEYEDENEDSSSEENGSTTPSGTPVEASGPAGSGKGK